MVIKRTRTSKQAANPYLTADSPEDLEPPNRIAYEIVSERRDLLPSVERIMNAELPPAATTAGPHAVPELAARPGRPQPRSRRRHRPQCRHGGCAGAGRPVTPSSLPGSAELGACGVAHVVELHGRPISYRQVGSGPVVLLVHGLGATMGVWDDVVDVLAGRCTVITLDLPGHGGSGPPAGDYSLGAYACVLRDLLDALGHERATIVGHSLGGGVAMQFCYQFPERVDRVVLVASGGLGREISPWLRAATLPGAALALRVAASRPVHWCGDRLRRLTAPRADPAPARHR